MQIEKKSKMGRRIGSGYKKIKLKALVEAVRLEHEVPVAFKWAREMGLVQEEVVGAEDYKDSLFD
tara:strand:+ start:1210 stop:1404 length:195 start_codon:yes stop_codon:yes gene_type:complete